MLRQLSILAIATSLTADVIAQPVPGLQGLGEPRYQRLVSETLGRDFHLVVGLPDGYEDDVSAVYPAVYLLDGGELFPMLAAYYRYLRWGEEIPDLILVAISYGSSDFASGNQRSHDYTAPSNEREYWGGAARFQEFLGTEVIPFVESRYRADPARRILFGQSLGGQFVLYTAQTDPDLFWGHIASNPALHRNLDFFLAQRPPPGPVASHLFAGSGTEDDPGFRGPFAAWSAHWLQAKDLPWALEVRDLPGHSHFSAPPAAFREGLRWLFSTDTPGR